MLQPLLFIYSLAVSSRFYPLDEILVQTIHILLRFNAANRQRYTSHLTTTSMSSIHLSLYNVSRIMGTRYA
jgi:hypothetical protein